MQPCSRIKRSLPRLGLELQSGGREYSQASHCLEMLQRVASRSEAKGALESRSKGTQLEGYCTNERELVQAQTYKIFTTRAKLFSWDQQGKNNHDVALWTAVTRSNHPAFLPGSKALTMTLLSFCFMWQQGFEQTTKMLPVYQHLSPGRALSLSRGRTGSSSNSISEASVVCWGKQACLHADTFPSVHSLFWVAAKKEEHRMGGSFLSGIGEQSHFLQQLSSSCPRSASLMAEWMLSPPSPITQQPWHMLTSWFVISQ